MFWRQISMVCVYFWQRFVTDVVGCDVMGSDVVGCDVASSTGSTTTVVMAFNAYNMLLHTKDGIAVFDDVACVTQVSASANGDSVQFRLTDKTSKFCQIIL